jgi:hypothetical protein
MSDELNIKYIESEQYAYGILLDLENQLDTPSQLKVEYYQSMINAFEKQKQKLIENG